MAMRLDGFALNVGDPRQPFVPDALKKLFTYALGKEFEPFVSLDVWAAGNFPAGKRGLINYLPIFNNYVRHEA
jgi:Glycosyl hydrolase family 71